MTACKVTKLCLLINYEAIFIIILTCMQFVISVAQNSKATCLPAGRQKWPIPVTCLMLFFNRCCTAPANMDCCFKKIEVHNNRFISFFIKSVNCFLEGNCKRYLLTKRSLSESEMAYSNRLLF